MSSPPTPKIEILDDEENIVNLEGEEDINDKYLSTLSANDEYLNNYVQLFDLYPQILRKYSFLKFLWVKRCSREFKKTFGLVNEIEYENGNTFEVRRCIIFWLYYKYTYLIEYLNNNDK